MLGGEMVLAPGGQDPAVLVKVYMADNRVELAITATIAMFIEGF